MDFQVAHVDYNEADSSEEIYKAVEEGIIKESAPIEELLQFGLRTDVNIVQRAVQLNRTLQHPKLPVLGSSELSFDLTTASRSDTSKEYQKTMFDNHQIRNVTCYHKVLKKPVRVSCLKKSAVSDPKLAFQVMLNTAASAMKHIGSNSDVGVIGFCAFRSNTTENSGYHIIGLVTC